MNPLTFNPAATEAWLRQPCPAIAEATRAECLGVDEEAFGPGLDGFLPALDDVLAAGPAGLDRRCDVTDVLLWLIPDGDILDQGALITVDLVDGIRLASSHQGVTAFADRGQRGIAAALAALAHIVDQVCLLVAGYERANPSTQPSACQRRRRR